MIIKCKMCGGDIEISSDKTFGTCEYCGSVMTFPKVDDEQRAAAFNRGNYFRRIGEFDKALAVYEHIVQEEETDAEAHWCCALSRFGIEYVEDPDTYEWLPTCHRVSFDSFLEDVDYLAALEHSDGITHRQYQKDGAKIAEVQRGILATSQNEEPFDVFICYKESDETGNRTKDSTLAQDIYYQLTEQGRRVFFARITLEDKVGAQYEPYIFAALNSAKVMVVVGTKPEYFNAVWVKNEWSRFLSLMKRDRNKLLLPCYWNMDPYDLPEQLSVLQSYDMSKIGFIQDLIRGVNKVLNTDKKQESVKENIVVQQSGNGANLESLIKRGNMALEDGDWDKADDFFEQVLNQDAECAEAYVGKFLVKHRKKTLENHIKTMLAQSDTVKMQKLSAIEPDKERISMAIQYYTIPNYLGEKEIIDLYSFDLTYTSKLSDRKRQTEEVKREFDKDKLFSRALRFAKGDYKKKLEEVRKSYFDALDQRVSNAEQEDYDSIENVKAAYVQHLATADEEVSRLYQVAKTKQEQDYQNACEMQNQAKEPEKFEEAASYFERIGDYQESRTRAEACKKEAAELREKNRVAEEKAKEARKKRNRILGGVIAAGIAIAVAVTFLVQNVIIPAYDYNKALALMENGKYSEAITAFKAMGEYKDASEKPKECSYQEALSLMESGEYPKAAIAFGKAGDYKDAKEHSVSLWDEIAQRYSVSAGYSYSVGLKSDGTVVAVGDNEYGQCDVSDWTDIVAITTGGNHTIGLKSDNTVVAVGYNEDGRCNVSNWTDIVAVSAGSSYSVGLKSDGTVVAVGYKYNGECDVSDWTDIVAVSAGNDYSVGLKADGKVVAVGYNEDGECDVSDWTDIVAVSAGDSYSVGLKSDGTMVAVGYNEDGECDVSDWTDIVAVSAGSNYTVVLRTDGTVGVVGQNYKGDCDVSGWKNIKLP